MNLWLRLLRLLLQQPFRGRIGLLATSSLRFRIWPNDLDIYRHVNNGRYLTLMDLGRMDLIHRTGLGPLMTRGRWAPLVAGVSIRFKRSLRVFESWTLCTRLLGWDQKWFYLEQKFERRGETVACAYVKGLFRGPSGNVHPHTILEQGGFTETSPVLSPDLQALFPAD